MNKKGFSFKFIKAKKYILFFATILLVLLAIPTLFLTQENYSKVERFFKTDKFFKDWFYVVFLIHTLVSFFCLKHLIFELYFATTSRKTLFNKRYSFGIILFPLLFVYFLLLKKNDIIPIIRVKVQHFGLQILIAEAIIFTIFFCIFAIFFRVKELFKKEVLAKKKRGQNVILQETSVSHLPKKSVLLTAKLAFFFTFFIVFLLSFLFLVLPFFIADYKQIFVKEKTKILTVIYYLSLLFCFPLFFFALPPISSYWRAKGYKIRPLLKTCIILVIIVLFPFKEAPIISYFDYLPLGVFVLLHGIFLLLLFYCAIDLVIRYQQLLESEKFLKKR